MKDPDAEKIGGSANRRSFITKGLLAGTATLGAGLLATKARAGSDEDLARPLTTGDTAIRRVSSAPTK